MLIVPLTPAARGELVCAGGLNRLYVLAMPRRFAMVLARSELVWIGMCVGFGVSKTDSLNFATWRGIRSEFCMNSALSAFCRSWER